MRMLPFALLALPILAACATPYERCVSRNGKDYIELKQQIATTEGNIERGYAIHKQTVPETVWGYCPRYRDGNIIGHRPCPETFYREIETPVVINVAEERRKLVALKAELPALQSRQTVVEAQCAAAHPAS